MSEKNRISGNARISGNVRISKIVKISKMSEFKEISEFHKMSEFMYQKSIARKNKNVGKLSETKIPASSQRKS